MGNQIVSRDALDLIPTPDPTNSYVPVSHFDLTGRVKAISEVILKDYTLIGEKYCVARQGNQLFALMDFKTDDSETALSVAYRNSYDRSMSIGIAVGAQVFICENLMISGDITVMKKHTKNVLSTLEATIITTLYQALERYQSTLADKEAMKGYRLNLDQGFQFLGLAYGHGIISPRQLTVAKELWEKPPYEEFSDRNYWSLYNACTEALKTSPPMCVMENHSKLHKALMAF
jgi:hypothetical protein